MQQHPEIATCELELNIEISRFNSRLLQELHNFPYKTEQLLEAALYSVGSSGHRWRPILSMRIYERLNNGAKPFDIVPIACAIELLHSASLILDDLPSADDAVLRRAKQPTHLRFNEARTIYVSHWLCDVAQHLIHEFEKSNRGRVREGLEDAFRQTKNEMLRGQIIDLEQTLDSEDEIIEKYRLKSGALYAFAASAPAHLLGLSEFVSHLSMFGNYLGISYQTSDDLHDQTASIEALGKDVRKDENTSTLVRLLGLRRAGQIRDYYKLKAINELSHLRIPLDDVTDLVNQICL